MVHVVQYNEWSVKVSSSSSSIYNLWGSIQWMLFYNEHVQEGWIYGRAILNAYEMLAFDKLEDEKRLFVWESWILYWTARMMWLQKILLCWTELHIMSVHACIDARKKGGLAPPRKSRGKSVYKPRLQFDWYENKGSNQFFLPIPLALHPRLLLMQLPTLTKKTRQLWTLMSHRMTILVTLRSLSITLARS